MFLKRHVRRKNGKDHTYWSLVKSERMAKGSRHRTLAYLGELDVVDCGGWAKLARELDDKPAPIIHPTLFDPEPDDEPVPEEVTVNVKDVRIEQTRDFGDVWLGLTLWRTLGLDRLFAQIMPKGREKVGWDLMATILVLGRFCDPSSELHIEDTWYPRTWPSFASATANTSWARLEACSGNTSKNSPSQAGRRSTRISKLSYAPRPMATRRSLCAAAHSVRRKKRQCTSGSPRGSSKALSRSPSGCRRGRSVLIGGPLSGRSGGCCRKTPGPPPSMTSG